MSLPAVVCCQDSVEIARCVQDERLSLSSRREPGTQLGKFGSTLRCVAGENVVTDDLVVDMRTVVGDLRPWSLQLGPQAQGCSPEVIAIAAGRCDAERPRVR